MAAIRKKSTPVVRYAVVGQGYIAQAAVLPAFRHARGNSRLVALVSGDPAKRRELIHFSCACRGGNVTPPSG